MAREIPLGMEGVEHFRPAGYDGPIQAIVLTEGGGTVSFETAGSDRWRISPAEEASVGDVLQVHFRADRRLGEGETWSEEVVDYAIVAADADPRGEDGFEAVPKGEPQRLHELAAGSRPGP